MRHSDDQNQKICTKDNFAYPNHCECDNCNAKKTIPRLTTADLSREKIIADLSFLTMQRMTEKLKQEGIGYELKKSKLNLWHTRMILILFPFEMVILTIIAYALLYK